MKRWSKIIKDVQKALSSRRVEDRVKYLEEHGHDVVNVKAPGCVGDWALCDNYMYVQIAASRWGREALCVEIDLKDVKYLRSWEIPRKF